MMLRRNLAILLLAAGASATAPRPGWLGVGYSYHLATSAKSPNWLFVERLAPHGPGERAGLHTQDVITAIDGKPLRFANDAAVLAFFRNLHPGQAIAFTVVRAPGKQIIRVVAEAMDDQAYAVWLRNGETAKRLATQPR